MNAAQQIGRNGRDASSGGRTIGRVLARVERKILVVDDDTDTSNAIKYMAENYLPSCQVEAVHDPYEAMLALADREFDLVLVDERIPGLKGSSMLSKIDSFIDEDPVVRDSLRYVHPVPVVLMSGSADLDLISAQYRNFVVTEKLRKRDLPNFLRRSFAS